MKKKVLQILPGTDLCCYSQVKIAQFLLKEKFEVSKVLISTQRRRRLRHVIVIALMHFFMLSELQFF